MLVAAWPAAEFQAMKKDLERNYLAVLRSVFGDRPDGARREERVAGSGAANHFRTLYGPGWALVGDAGYLKDPITAQGITDAFHDAELCTQAVDESFTGNRTYTEAMASYQRRRDARVPPLYEFTTQIGDFSEPLPPELLQLLGAIAGNQDAMNQFARHIRQYPLAGKVLRPRPHRPTRRQPNMNTNPIAITADRPGDG
jgi:flavin-dependent dehydrogenase